MLNNGILVHLVQNLHRGRGWPDPGEAELQWFGWKLYTATLLHRGVTLVMHIPPGMDAYNSARGWMPEAGSFFWKAKYATEFKHSDEHLFRRRAAGLRRPHSHGDDFRVSTTSPPSLPLRITPAVSPIFKNNPAFSVMTYNLTTASVSDITTFFIPLSSGTPAWSKEYQFDSAYGVSSFSAANLSTVAAAIKSGDGARRKFENNYAVSTPSPIDPSNFLFYSCAQTHVTAASYGDCVCGAAASASQKHAPR